MIRASVFDSGAGGQHVAELLLAADIAVTLTTHPGLFPFGNRSAAYLHQLFLDYRSSTHLPVFCACNTMSLVLVASGYEFERNRVVPTFPVIKATAPIVYGSNLCTELATSMCPELKVRPVPRLIDAAEALYREQISIDEARQVWDYTVTDSQIQLGSTHLSYLAHKLGVKGHVEPDYLAMWRESGYGSK